ncbi:hypothetical protein PV325_013363 [Microctonus aethiopoides]|uniref:Uncharacterized protein n=1 Tax=Microctonus aethiopoides TaxID=144406 RepID=A0AA39FXM7_9HYME|nr:hypothetical protein PV326_010043 [Microctonus aethiopoides]KAK0080762.1 hypothetical protein PV325_013363 [Microctonus aethiopoides]KAK0177719.1 hypothetical protein PV328_001741 [Microctonus aethiopoides]
MTTTTQDISLDRVRGNRYHRLTGRPVYGFMASPLLTGTGVPVDGNGAATAASAATEPGSLVAACVRSLDCSAQAVYDLPVCPM